jgi:hypothetical protein
MLFHSQSDWLDAEMPTIASALVQLSEENVIHNIVRIYVDDTRHWYTVVSFESLTTLVPDDQEQINKEESTRLGLIRNFDSLPKDSLDWGFKLATKLLSELEDNV